jgi:hypothetical protein
LTFLSQSIFSQAISTSATTDLDSFLATDDDSETYTSGPLYNHADYITTSANKYHQVIYNNGATNTVGRVTIKSQYKRHQKTTPITGLSGEIITIKMKFKTKGTLIADNNVFLFGLKSVLDATNTVAPVSGSDPDVKNGEWATVHVDTNNKLNLRYKTNLATEAFDDNNTCYVTLKYFIGDSRANSRIKMKLENGDSSSGWVNQSWTSQLLYNALTGSGAYIIFSSEKALGTSDSQPQIYLDDYEFTTDDSGMIQLGTNNINVASAWSTGLLPTDSDRLFILNKPESFINNSSESKTYDYLYINEDSKLTINAIDKLTINELDNDGQLDVESSGFTEGNLIVGSFATNAFDENITLDDTQNELTVASGGLLLRQSSMLCHYYTPDGGSPGPYWNSYDGSSWSHDASFPDGTTDYSSKNLVYSTQAHSAPLTGTNSFNDVYILDGKKMIIASKDDTNNTPAGNITVENIYAQDATDAESGIMYSGSSLIVNGTSTANITYNRYLGTDNWYLVSSPLAGETIANLISNNSFASATDGNIGLSTYNGSDDTWTYNTLPSTGAINSGTGYSVKLNAAGNVYFTGTIPSGDTQITDLTASKFNLIGNPYTSYVTASSLLANNSANLSEQTTWIWDQNEGSYTVYNNLNDIEIAPGQGFFIKSNTNTTFDIAASSQSHQTSDSFQRPMNHPQINLFLNNGSITMDTDIFYVEETTTGWDNGYDSSIFGGVANEFAIYTHTVANGNGRNLGIQSLPPNNYENMIIPIGINAEAGTTVTIDAATNNFPSGINIYLEDKQDNSFTLLEADANFSFIPENNLSGIGRFYLHTTSSVLSADDFSTNNNISIYTSSKENLRIVGVQNGTATVQLYNILGKEMLKTSFEGNGVNNINLNTIPMGIYIVKLATENGVLNRKIIIQ